MGNHAKGQRGRKLCIVEIIRKLMKIRKKPLTFSLNCFTSEIFGPLVFDPSEKARRRPHACG
jgi:hypothetical protein